VATNDGRAVREWAWLEAEVAASRHLTDEQRIDILVDLLDASDAIRAGKSAEELRREEEAREILDRPGKERYRALAERLA